MVRIDNKFEVPAFKGGEDDKLTYRRWVDLFSPVFLHINALELMDDNTAVPQAPAPQEPEGEEEGVRG